MPNETRLSDGFSIRLAREDDIPSLENMIRFPFARGWPRSIRRLKFDAALGPVFGVERQLICAFFVHPDWTRRGIGTAIRIACETAIRAAEFREAILVAALTGEAL